MHCISGRTNRTDNCPETKLLVKSKTSNREQKTVDKLEKNVGPVPTYYAAVRLVLRVPDPNPDL